MPWVKLNEILENTTIDRQKINCEIFFGFRVTIYMSMGSYTLYMAGLNEKILSHVIVISFGFRNLILK